MVDQTLPKHALQWCDVLQNRSFSGIYLTAPIEIDGDAKMVIGVEDGQNHSTILKK